MSAEKAWCIGCGSQISATALFCRECGREQPADLPAASAPREAPAEAMTCPTHDGRYHDFTQFAKRVTYRSDPEYLEYFDVHLVGMSPALVDGEAELGRLWGGFRVVGPVPAAPSAWWSRWPAASSW